MKDVKSWLEAGSINIFGKPFAGKDTVGESLAKLLDGSLIGGGDILRNNQEHAVTQAKVEDGSLAPTGEYLRAVLPYFSREEFAGHPLILSSFGRWHGEESAIIDAAEKSEHPLKAVIYIDVAEDEIHRRWEKSQELADRGQRQDDGEGKLDKRIDEFNNKTMPVLDFYRDQGLLIEVNGINSREAVMQEIIDKLTTFAAAQ